MRKDEEKILIEKLESYGFLEYGKIIPREIMEDLLQAKVEKGWEFLSPFLSLKESLEIIGFLSTTRNLDKGCLRILEIDEIVPCASNAMERCIKTLKKLQSCFLNAKINEFEDREIQKHCHTSNIITTRLYAMTNIISSI